MKTILGRINGEWLANVLTESRGACTGIDAAVAYADMHEPLLQYLRETKVPVRFFGRWDATIPVSVPLLHWFVEKAPTNVRCFLVNGPYHPKVIWWHGFGAYIGSANLTKNGWERNVECGLFLSEDELYEQNVAAELETMLKEVESASFELGRDDLPDIDRLAQRRSKVLAEMKSMDDEFQRLFGDAEEKNSKAKVEASFTRNRLRSDDALVEAAHWWKGLAQAPTRNSTYSEARFIHEVAPRLRHLLSATELPILDHDRFVEAMSGVNAFRDHGRRANNIMLGLPPGTELNEDERIRHFAGWMFRQRTASGRTPLDVLAFVIHDRSMPRAEDRIWTAIREPTWRIKHLGKSALGELLGWARPTDYPPRNDRTNKALRALGYDVMLFEE